MGELIVQAYVSTEHTFCVTCPKCKREKLLRLSDFPPNATSPLPYPCACGVSLKIMLNYRKTPRKLVRLVGVFTVPSEPKKIERLCEVLDISDLGMRITIDYCKTIVQGRLIITRIILDDAQRSKLDLPCVVCSITPDNRRLMLGLRFEGLNESQKQALGYYTMSLKS
jgi:hypothetical protein